jgi:predicted Ser/Thr protein kinase
MYFVSNKHKGLEYLKGAKIMEKEIDTVCDHIRSTYEDMKWDDSYKFTIDFEITDDVEGMLAISPVATAQEIEDALFARIIIWSLERETVSANAIHLAFKDDKVGERQSKKFLERLQSLGIVGEMAKKRQGRKVLITCVEDLPDEARVIFDRYICNAELNGCVSRGDE